ncbi:MAG TPA: hypothetical protein VKP61_06580 [Candidatus Acidoferrum sp.]|nr:hypothetical protein [Candidatus Acidoferrum sp.]
MRGKRGRGSPAQSSLKFPNELGALRRFWQKRFYDSNVWSGKKLIEKLDFFTRDREAVNMHANPVIRGLVKHPKDWAWSSSDFT